MFDGGRESTPSAAWAEIGIIVEKTRLAANESQKPLRVISNGDRPAFLLKIVAKLRQSVGEAA